MSPEDMFHQQMFEMSNSNGDYSMPAMTRPPIQPLQSAAMPSKRIVSNKVNIATYKVLLKNPSKFNKKLIDYFIKNIHKFNRKYIKFEWIPVFPDEMEYYEEQNITKFPTLIIDENNNIEGTNEIIKKLNVVLNADLSKQSSKSTAAKSSANGGAGVAGVARNDGDMKNYFMNALKDNTEDEDEVDTFRQDLNKKAADMMRVRESYNKTRKSGGDNDNNGGNMNQEVYEQQPQKKSVTFDLGENDHHNQPTVSTNVVDILKNSKSSNSQDDEMMMKFFENQEDTEM